MPRISGIAESLDNRLKSTVKAHGLNIDDLAARTLVEGVLRYWPYGMGPAPIMLKGGGLFCQSVRETADADILVFRSYTNAEIQNGMKIIAPLLERERITVEFLSPTPKEIDTGYGDPVIRYDVRGRAGGVRANSHIDMSVARGPYAVPRASEISEIPSIVPKLPPLVIACQPLEAAAAEKLLAVVLQSDTDFRIKHLADLLNEPLWEGVDCRQVAREVLRTCRHRGIDVADLPEIIGFPAIRRLEAAWEKHRATGKTALPIQQVYVDVEYLWQSVREELDLCLSPRLHDVTAQSARASGMAR